MAHGRKLRKFSRPSKQTLILMRSLATDLALHGKITTTTAKCKSLRPYFERLLTRAKDANLHNIKHLHSTLFTKEAVKSLLDLAPQVGNNGGYTRIIKLGFRKGDAADMSTIMVIKNPAQS